MGPFRRSMPTSKLALTLFFLGWSLLGLTQIRLPRLISDGMVLQRDQNLKLWGWASAQENINISIKDKTYRGKADQAGNWSVTVPPQAAGGPFEINLKGKNELQIRDVYFGDVWICAGQSNMVLPMERQGSNDGYGIDHASCLLHALVHPIRSVRGPQCLVAALPG